MQSNKLYEKAVNCIKSKNYPKAIEYFDQLIALNPKDADAFSDRGVSKYHVNDLKGAMEDMNQSLELDPENAYRYASRAYIRERNGDTNGAIEDYKKAIQLDPEDAISQNNLGMLEEKLGYMSQAKKRYEVADTLVSKGGVKKNIAVESNEAVGVLLNELNIQVERKERDNPSFLQYFLSVFHSKKSRSEYWTFLKSLFKRK